MDQLNRDGPKWTDMDQSGLKGPKLAAMDLSGPKWTNIDQYRPNRPK